MTNEQLRTIVALAMEIADDAPPKFSKFGHHAYISRGRITALRIALDAAGLPWRGLVRPVAKK